MDGQTEKDVWNTEQTPKAMVTCQVIVEDQECVYSCLSVHFRGEFY